MITIFFGKIGSGKTSFLAEAVRKNEQKKRLLRHLPFLRFLTGDPYDHIYSNEVIKGTEPLPASYIGAFEPEGKCLFLIDEAGVYFNARRFKSLPQYTTDFFAMSRHYDSDIILTSQTVDIDKSLRNRAARLYEVRKSPFGRSAAYLIRYKIGVDEVTHDLVEGYYLFPKIVYLLLPSIFGLKLKIRRKRVYNLFNTKSRTLRFKYDGYSSIDDLNDSRAELVLPEGGANVKCKN